jgi:tRNA(Ile)-lysidine synthase
VWSPEQNFITLPAQQTLCCLPASTGILREQWQNAVVSIRARRGGERISLPHREGYHSLKKLFQERGIPPWEREYIPLVYLNDELAAIGTLWISAAFYAEKEGMCISLARKSALDLSAE